MDEEGLGSEGEIVMRREEGTEMREDGRGSAADVIVLPGPLCKSCHYF